MPSKSSEPSEADIIFNRASVALARSQRLISSWLPAPASSHPANNKTEEELAQEEAERFTPVPELLGVGATPPTDAKDGLPRRKDKSGLDELRKQLLGKNAKGRQGATALASGSSKAGSKPLPSKSLPPKSTRDNASDDEEEVGRSAVFRSSKKTAGLMLGKKRDGRSRDGGVEEKGAGEEESEGEEVQRGGNTRGASFLDEVLAEKEKKSKKKKRRKGGLGAERE